MFTRALLAAVWISTAASAGETIDAWSAGEAGVKPAHLALPLEEGEFYSDRYTAEAWFKDGSRVWVSFLVSNLGPGTHKLTVKSRWYETNGKEHYLKKELDAGDYTASAEPFKVSGAGITLSGSPRAIRVVGTVDGYSYDLTFKSGLAPWRPGTGRTVFGTDTTRYLDATLVQPKAVVTGSVTKGGKTALEGFGYVTHTIANIAPYDMQTRFIEIRSIDTDTVVWLKQFKAPEKFGGKTYGYLYVARGGEVLVASKAVNLKLENVVTDSKHPNKYKVPLLITASGKRKGKDITIRVEAPKIDSRDDELQSRNAFEAALIKQYAQPVNYGMDGTVTVTVTEEGKEPVVSTAKAAFTVSHLNK